MNRFALAGRYTRGYRPEQVDRFFEHAQATYEGRMAADAPTLTSQQVRTVAFDLAPGGYDIHQVDTALDRLQDELAVLERDRVRSLHGDQAMVQELLRQAQALRERLNKPGGQRFDRGESLAELAYSPRDVDDLCDQVLGYLDGHRSMSVDQVRQAIFRMRRGKMGYRESQVDAFLDRVVEVMVKAD